MFGNTCNTSRATTRPASEGTANRRQLWVCGSGPSKARCIQSMARRKHTTARPEKIPMKTERMRKKASSLKTPSRVENKRREVWNRGPVTRDDGTTELALRSGLLIGRRPHLLGDQEQREVDALRLATDCRGLLFDLEDNVHDVVGEVGFGRRVEASQVGLCGNPARLQAGERRHWGRCRGIEVNAGLPGALGKTLFGLGKCGSHAAIAFRVGDVTLERVGSENEIGGCEKLESAGILRIGADGSLQIALSGSVVAGVEGGLASPGQGGGVRGIEVESLFILG